MPAKTSRFAMIADQIDLVAVRQSTCRTCDFLTNPARYDSNEADVEFIASLLDSRSAAHVSKVLDDGGVKISETSIKRHLANHS